MAKLENRVVSSPLIPTQIRVLNSLLADAVSRANHERLDHVKIVRGEVRIVEPTFWVVFFRLGKVGG